MISYTGCSRWWLSGSVALGPIGATGKTGIDGGVTRLSAYGTVISGTVISGAVVGGAVIGGTVMSGTVMSGTVIVGAR